jgi:hypothetical protein
VKRESDGHVSTFSGKKDQAKCIHEVMMGYGLTEIEDFVLLRYLGLDIPENLQKYWSIEDGVYRSARRSVLKMLPEEAVSILE